MNLGDAEPRVFELPFRTPTTIDESETSSASHIDFHHSLEEDAGLRSKISSAPKAVQDRELTNIRTFRSHPCKQSSSCCYPLEAAQVFAFGPALVPKDTLQRGFQPPRVYSSEAEQGTATLRSSWTRRQHAFKRLIDTILHTHFKVSSFSANLCFKHSMCAIERSRYSLLAFYRSLSGVGPSHLKGTDQKLPVEDSSDLWSRHLGR